ncbi:MAG: DegT/DnrJ/EryC1/StrS family aminotransferase [Nanoarchaeota archaeon]|nr:DegT/DnrJ/EryC1/StrS family aminotransferase [Nanoarchaeota archaeon]MBU1703729.1 DegT/DnrJ/EryC1/StrS family aminotransferase [Nanoarchaeota archaeon]
MDLNELTGKEHIKLVSRGNKALLYALKIAKKLGYTKVLIQDQGGWITYKQIPVRLKLDFTELKTDYGIIDLKDLEAKADENTVLLINSMPGYFALEDMDEIESVCIRKKCFLINDATGSIGTKAAKKGDIIVASFGDAKPIDLGKGALIATDDKELFDNVKIDEEELPELDAKLEKLPKRLDYFEKIHDKIIKELKGHDIIHPKKKGINVIVKFTCDEEKEDITNYCLDNKYEYTLCPRYIRVECDAISIEVKRL